MFKIETEIIEHCAVIHIQGDLTVTSAAELEREIGMKVSRGTDKFVLDFSGLDFIDSRGAGSLVKINGAYYESIYVTGLSPQMRETLTRLMVYEKFKVTKSVEDALARLK